MDVRSDSEGLFAGQGMNGDNCRSQCCSRILLSKKVNKGALFVVIAFVFALSFTDATAKQKKGRKNERK